MGLELAALGILKVDIQSSLQIIYCGCMVSLIYHLRILLHVLSSP